MIKIFFKTYGCQANLADTEKLELYLGSIGCSVSRTEDDADAILINTCAVREKAEHKMFTYLGSLKKNRILKPYLRIGIIGCVASYKKDEIFKRFDHVNFVFGARGDIKTFQAYLSDMVQSLKTSKSLYEKQPERFIPSGQDRSIVNKKKLIPNIKAVSDQSATDQSATDLSGKGLKRSFINIMTGCNNYCTYCIVPFTRGRERSYSMQSILDRVKHDVESGVKEITLIGQNVNSYLDPNNKGGFAILLKRIAEVDGEFWVRFISPHPKDMTEDVLDVIAEHRDKLCDWIHMPLQSGSNKILGAMNRSYTVDRYMETIGWINKKLPGAMISTDIIVGFPGETDKDYLETREVMEKVKYDLIYSFIYSRRKHTLAYSMPDDTPMEVKSKRLSDLQDRAKEIGLERNLLYIGKIVRTLFEKRLPNGRLLARTSGNVRVIFDGVDSSIGSFIDIKIEKASPANLEGIALTDQSVTDKSV